MVHLGGGRLSGPAGGTKTSAWRCTPCTVSTTLASPPTLLAAVRADLVVYLIDDQKLAPEDLRASLSAYIGNVLGDSSGSR